MSIPRWITKVDPQDRSGLVQEAAGTSFAGAPRFIRDEVLQRQIEPLNAGLPIDITGATLKVAVGQTDLAPTDGSFSLSYSGSSANLTGLSYAIDKTALETALNLNVNIAAAGGVTVKGTTALFTITFNNVGVRSLLTGDDTALLPPSYIRILRKETGSVTKQEVQTLQIFQRPFAYSEDWTPNSAGSVVITSPVVGDASTAARYQIAFSDTPYGGAVRFTWSVPQTMRATFAANVGTTRVEYIDFTTCTASGLGGGWIDFYKVDGSIVRFWFNENLTDTAPPTPPGGSLVVVNYGAAAAADAITTAFATAIDGNAEFSAAASGSLTAMIAVVVRAANGSHQATTATATGGAPSIQVITAGSDGPLAGKCLPLVDRFGSVGVYFTAGGTTSLPTAAAACDRQIVVALTTNDTAANVATAFRTAVEADAEFTASVTSNTVDITDAYPGSRETLTGGTATGCSVVVTRAGRVVAASLPYGSDASVLGHAINDEFAVTVLDSKTWILVANAPGVIPTPTVADESLIWPRYFTGTLRFDTVALEYAFNASKTTAQSIDAPLEIVITYAGEEPECILQVTASCDRNLIRSTGLSTPSFTAPLSSLDGISMLWATTDYIGGAANQLDSLSTTTLAVPRMVAFVDTTNALHFYRLRAGTDAEASPGIIRPDDFNAVTNAKVWESVL
jgi:hypothetical protein